MKGVRPMSAINILLLSIFNYDYLPWVWLVVFILSLLVEFATVSLVSIWLAIGALAALLANLAGVGVTGQIILMVLVSLFTFIASFKFKPLRNLLSPAAHATNIEALIGHEATVLEEVGRDTQIFSGKIKLKGQVWSAVSCDEAVHPAGSVVTVKEIKGVFAYVEALNK